MQIITWLILVIVVSIQSVTARHAAKAHVRSRKLAVPEPEPLPSLDSIETHEAEIVSDSLNCPLGCQCQYAHFNDLSTARWINQLKSIDAKKSRVVSHEENMLPYEQEEEDGVVVDDDDDDGGYLSNPLMSQATCILQADSDVAPLFNSLPMDLRSLIVLVGVGREITVNTSMLLPLNQLNTLELRGVDSASMLRLIIDEPLSFLQYANFEHVRLLGSENFKRAETSIDPIEEFDYKPRVEFYASNENGGEIETSISTVSSFDGRAYKYKLDFQLAREDELEILPYEVYKLQVKKSRMPSFYGWSSLEVLRIHGCQLSELHWEIFDGLTALQHLSLERNDIEVLPPFALYGALHIKSLSLAHNSLHKLHYRALGGLLELEVLDLRDNRLEKLSELSFPPFPKLTRIDFRNNPLRYIFPATFWVMNETREMNFGSAEAALELWGNHPFDSLHKLRELSIANVSINTLDQGVFKGLNSLESLKLRGDIYSIEFDAFAGMHQLRTLDLSECNIQEVSMDALMGCKQLESLNLSHNNISYIPPGFFDDQNLLQDVYLEHNQLRSLPHKFFQLPKLSLARLTDNPWQCTCDMNNWRPKVTNVERGSSEERCISDYMTGKPISCRRIDHFKHDRRLAPRCANFNGQSVYYVRRKRLHCGEGHVFKQLHGKTLKRGLPHWQKMAMLRQKQESKGKIGQFQILHSEAKQQERRQTWSQKRNSIETVLKMQQHQHQEDREQTEKKRDDDEEEALMTNEI